MLALLLLLHHATARDATQDTYITKKIDPCPDVGYYFTRDSSPNAIEPGCHLCFCQDNATAVCWRRDVRRCDAKHYRHFGRRKRFTRVRRSPGFGDIFFSDATKDVFDKNTPEECKPYESSYSEGCPPADWCIGCTVCDCNANGRWDCHLLSFCPDEKGKKKMKKKRAKVGKRQGPKKAVSTTTKILNPTTTQKPNKKNSPKKSNFHPVRRNQSKANNVPVKPQSETNKGKPQKIIPVIKPKATANKKTPTPKSKNQANKKNIIKSKNPPAVLEKGKTNSFDEDAILKNITHTIFNKVMTSVEKMINERQKSITQAIQQKTVQKRSMPHFNNTKSRKISSAKPIFKNVKKEPKRMKNNQNPQSNKSRRSKREISAITSSYIQEDNVPHSTDSNVTEKLFVYHTLDNDIVFVTPIVKILTRPSYFKYTIDLEKANVNTLHKLNDTRRERLVIPERAKNTLNEVTSTNADLKMKSLNESTHDIKENNLKISSKEHARNTFTKELRNISNALIANSARNGNNITKNLENNFALRFNITCEKTCKFKKFLRKIVRFNNKNTTMPNDKIKTFNILKYLKRIFRKVFVTRKVKDNSKATMQQSNNKQNLIRNLCKNFGSCKLDLKNKTLSSKIDELRAESYKIMKSIRTIKGLLKLLDIDDKKIKGNLTSINNQFSNKDIEILSAIIKDKYEEYNFGNLTETQSIQVSYIKQNTKIFLQSLEKFAQSLRDIVKILTNHKTPHSKDSNRYYRNLKNQAYSNVIKSNKNNTIGEKLDKMKELLTSYNLVQNQFMKQMYDVLIKLRPKQNQTANSIKVSNENKNNNTVAIEIYTQNIIENLRKLKDLVQKLRLKNRRKRESMGDDDVVEYLLILMEYLLKQQKQLKTSPVNDGIDLLIEAIKTAPDIKATRKKVLDYIPINVEIETTEATSAFLNANEIVNKTVVATNPAVPKFKTFESIDEYEEINDFYQYNKKVHKNSNIKKTKSDTEDVSNEDATFSLTTPSYYVTFSYLVDDEKSNAVLDKMDTKKKDDDKRFQEFVDDTEEDDANILTTTKSPDKNIVKESVKARLNGPMRTTPYYILRDEQSMSKDSVTHKSQNNRIKLDWIEDSYTQEDERKELPRFKETTTQKIVPTHTIEVATRTIRNKEKKVNKYDDPVSSISREIADEDKKKAKYLNSEYVMYKKQMNLLNSLDYVTEKIELEEDLKEDKSNVESFPLYF